MNYTRGDADRAAAKLGANWAYDSYTLVQGRWVLFSRVYLVSDKPVGRDDLVELATYSYNMETFQRCTRPHPARLVEYNFDGENRDAMSHGHLDKLEVVA